MNQNRQHQRYQTLRQKAPIVKTGNNARMRKTRIQIAAAPTMPDIHTVPRLPVREQIARAMARLDVRLMPVRRAHMLLASIPVFMAGAAFGLVVLGWGLFPVQWTDASLSALRAEDQALFIELAADLYSIDHNTERAQRVMGWDANGTAVCSTLDETEDAYQRERMAYLAMAVRGVPCNAAGN